MMEEDNLHSDLSNRIREVFDNYEDTTADEGWAMLRQKFPEKEKDPGLAWLWYAAAAVVLLCVGLWFTIKPDTTQNLNLQVQHQKNIIQPNTPVTSPTSIDSAQHHTGSNSAPYTAHGNTLQSASPMLQPRLAVTTRSQANTTATQPQLVVTTQHQANITIPTTTNTTVEQSVIPQNNQANTIAAISKTDSGSAVIKNTAIATVNKKTDSVVANATEKYAGVSPVQTQKPSSANAVEQMLSEKSAVKNSIAKTQNPSGKKTIMSVYAATYFNYAKGSDNNINIGAGLSSDFKLTKNLKLSAGVAIAQNTLKYSNTAIESGDVNNSVSLAKTALDQVYASSAPSASNLVAGASTTNGLRGFAIATFVSPTLQGYNANLIGLDIPINLKYQFNPQKTDAFISAGLSSGTFINETYTLNYTYAKNDQQSTTHTSFSGFDLAKTLNVSFGIGYQLGKSNRLIFEPFLKYPLDGLGSQQIKFGAGGINLKLNFQSAKK